MEMACSGGPGTVCIDGYTTDESGVQTPFSYSADTSIKQEIIFPAGAKSAVVNLHCHTACITLTLDIVSNYTIGG